MAFNYLCFKCLKRSVNYVDGIGFVKFSELLSILAHEKIYDYELRELIINCVYAILEELNKNLEKMRDREKSRSKRSR